MKRVLTFVHDRLPEIVMTLILVAAASYLGLVFLGQPSNRVENRGYVVFPAKVCPMAPIDNIVASVWINKPDWITIGDGTAWSSWERLGPPADLPRYSSEQQFPANYSQFKPGLTVQESKLQRIAPSVPGKYRMILRRSYPWKAYGFPRTTSDVTNSEQILNVLPYGSPNPQAELTGKLFCD